MECIYCGWCCMALPCSYGKIDPNTGYCKYLVLGKETDDFKQYVCSQIKKIKNKKGAAIDPMFGTGCKDWFFNHQRRTVFLGLRKRS